MDVKTKSIQLNTNPGVDIVDITDKVRQALTESGLDSGIVTVFVPGSTASVTTVEYESGLVVDLKRAFERIAPRDIHYDHDYRWQDGNGHSHIRASLLGPSVTVPFAGGALMLGTWQQIVFVELDVRQRNRTVIIQIIGN